MRKTAHQLKINQIRGQIMILKYIINFFLRCMSNKVSNLQITGTCVYSFFFCNHHRRESVRTVKKKNFFLSFIFSSVSYSNSDFNQLNYELPTSYSQPGFQQYKSTNNKAVMKIWDPTKVACSSNVVIYLNIK